MAKLDAEAVGSTRAQVESKLAKVQHALAVSEEARHKRESAFFEARRSLATSEEAR